MKSYISSVNEIYNFPDGRSVDLLRGRWFDKVGLWERRLGQVRLWRRWLDKIRGRLPEDIQLQTRWPGRICGQWVSKNTSCRQLQFTKVLCFPMVFNDFENPERSRGKIELWERWLDKIQLCGRWLDQNRERWLDKIRFERRWLDKIQERWLDKMLFWGWWHLQGQTVHHVE